MPLLALRGPLERPLYPENRHCEQRDESGERPLRTN